MRNYARRCRRKFKKINKNTYLFNCEKNIRNGIWEDDGSKSEMKYNRKVKSNERDATMYRCVLNVRKRKNISIKKKEKKFSSIIKNNIHPEILEIKVTTIK